MPNDRDALAWLNIARVNFGGYDDAVGNDHAEAADESLRKARAAVEEARKLLTREKQQRG